MYIAYSKPLIMELSKSHIHSLEKLILHSEIPYEDVKIELIDHLATDIEIRMETNPDLSFGDAIRISSTDIKDSIISIQKDIEQSQIRRSLVESFGFRNTKSSVIFMFFALMAYGMFLALGTPGAPIVPSILGLTMIGLIIGALRLRGISRISSLQTKYRKQNYWIPMLLAACLTLLVSITFMLIIIHNNFWYYINDLLTIPIALSYGFLLKVIIHGCTSYIGDIKTRADIDQQFLEVA